MPNYKGHIFGGLVCYALVLFFGMLYYVPLFTLIQWLCCTLAGSLFPDIDIKSKGQQAFYKVILLVVIYGMITKAYVLALFLSIFSFFPLLVKHRGMFHNFWFLGGLVIVTSELLAFAFPHLTKAIATNSLFFFLGIISHLWLDMGIKKMLRFR